MKPHVQSKKTGTPRWVFVVVGLLAGHVTLMVCAVTFALRGYGSAGVEPDYYARAVAWDADREALQRSEDLGWQVTLTPDIWRDADGRRAMRVVMLDAADQAIDDAEVSLRMHHAVHTKRRADAVLKPEGRGTYAAKLADVSAGLWRVDLRIVRDTANTTPTEWLGRFDQQVADVVSLTRDDAAQENRSR